VPLTIRPLLAAETDAVDACLPLNRLDTHRQGRSVYLVAWDDDRPVGHAFLDLATPELQDVFVLPEERRRGVASALTAEAERLATEQGHPTLGLTVSETNDAARRLYERLGYADAGLPPKRVLGTIQLRGAPFEVDDTLLSLVKRLR
jgi:ribosomal protein S18 acetylase RimI-like enzyme